MDEVRNIRCVIVDDEPLALEGLVSYASKIPFITVAGAFQHPLDALKKMQQDDIDLLILDIQMPDLNGLDLLKSLQKKPYCIIVSANPAFAIAGYEFEVTDYLLKPLSFERFTQAITRVNAKFLEAAGRKKDTVKENDFFFIKSGSRYDKIYVSEIDYIEGLQNYITIYTAKGKHIAYVTLKAAEEKLIDQDFIKPHKSFLVARSAVKAIDGNELVLASGNKIPISRDRKEEILQVLLGNKIFKRD